jgi:O-methyltransferase
MKVSPHLPGRAIDLLAQTARRIEYARLQKRFYDYTMVRHPVPGLIVECGVWRGGMSAAIASVVGLERTYYLFDSFEGLPEPKELDGQKAKEWSAGADPETFHDNCRAEEQTAAEAMRLAGVKNAHLIKGWFDQTLPSFQPKEPIAILRLDGDWYDSTICCLTHLYDKVARGGVIIIDDYHAWEGCTRAVHDFLSQRKSPEPVKQFDNILAYIVKQ